MNILTKLMILEKLSKNINNFDVEKQNIELFLKLKENQILERLKLINDNPKELYNKIQSKNNEIDKEIEHLKNIKDLLSIYYSNYSQKNKEIDNFSLENNSLNETDKKNNLLKEIYMKNIKKILKQLKKSKILYFLI